jgi:hypothetical protein
MLRAVQYLRSRVRNDVSASHLAATWMMTVEEEKTKFTCSLGAVRPQLHSARLSFVLSTFRDITSTTPWRQ